MTAVLDKPTAAAQAALPPQSHWLWVMCLIGVDYFSTLAYQPSITFEVAGSLGPPATVVVVLLTLFGAVPVYCYVAGRSPHGQGSIALFERLLRGWRGKTVILLLLGFAATDFVMTKTLSLADAAEHVIHNDAPHWQHWLDGLVRHTGELIADSLGQSAADYFDRQMIVTILLGVVYFIFWAILRRGFNRQAIRIAVAVVAVYMVLTAVIIGSGLAYLTRHPERFQAFVDQITGGSWRGAGRPITGDDFWGLAILCLLFFPQLSLGLSGFEMSLVVMPQVRGKSGDDPARPRGRIRNTRKLLVLAAVIMSVFLLSSVMVTNTLINSAALRASGPANNRALAYLAHGGWLVTGETADQMNPLFGHLFGTLYDLSTIVILCLAGTSVITGLQTLLPRYLLRFGMELKWMDRWGLLLGLFAVVNLAVTLWFRASVMEQRGAYATGVLVLITSACFVTVINRWRDRPHFLLWRIPWYFGLITLVFLTTAIYLIVTNPSGLLIAGGFIVVIVACSVFSRAFRNRELRTEAFEFKDELSKLLWDSMKHFEFPVLVPHRPGRRERDAKERSIRQEHQLAADIDIVFIETEISDASDFYQKPLLEVSREANRFVVRVSRCVSAAHAIAAVALELSKAGKPPALHFGWSEMSLLEATLSYLVFGEGNVPWRVRELILREQPDPERRPRVIIG